MAATWPDLHIPVPDGPTALVHMKRILKAAQDAKASQATDIDKAIEACTKGECLYGDPPQPPQRGKPPPYDTHSMSVLAARVHAGDSPDWDKCLKALRHGEAVQEQAKKSRAQNQ